MNEAVRIIPASIQTYSSARATLVGLNKNECPADDLAIQRSVDVITKNMYRTLILAATLALLPASAARADWQLVPRNSHALYTSYGLWRDDQSSLLYAGAGRAYADLGGSFALLGEDTAEWHPQLVLLASVNSTLNPSGPGGGIGADELDVRLGASFELMLNSLMRVSVGYLHLSGHSTEDTLDRGLLEAGSAVSDNLLFARLVYDLGPYLRAGVTFSPVIQGSPAVQFFGANQFVEYFPLGGLDESGKPSPYLALSFSENGTAQFGNQLTFHAQLGAYFGNHFSREPKATLRPVAGFYTGADPRLKYFQLRGSTQTFGYAGISFDF